MRPSPLKLCKCLWGFQSNNIWAFVQAWAGHLPSANTFPEVQILVDTYEDSLIADRALFTTHRHIYEDPKKAKLYIRFLCEVIAKSSKLWKLCKSSRWPEQDLDSDNFHHFKAPRAKQQNWEESVDSRYSKFWQQILSDALVKSKALAIPCPAHETKSYILNSMHCDQTHSTLTSCQALRIAAWGF